VAAGCLAVGRHCSVLLVRIIGAVTVPMRKADMAYNGFCCKCGRMCCRQSTWFKIRAVKGCVGYGMGW
jgi:hypothetical protein